MDTLTIKIKDSKALKLIHDPADLDLIQVLESPDKKPARKLSEILMGSTSTNQAEQMHLELKEMRKEWERNTY